MKKLTPVALTAFLAIIFVYSCKKDNLINTEPSPQVTINLPNNYSEFDGAESYVISQNYLMKMITNSMTIALLTPNMHGLQGPDYAVTRSCPTITSTTGSPNTLTIDYGTDCIVSDTLGGDPDTISGLIYIEAYGPITNSSTNTFLRFDELKINGKLIRFVPGNPSAADWIKFQFTGGASGNFTYNAFIDGTVPAGSDPAFDRGQFQIIDCETGDSLVLYPSYSGTTAFNFQYLNPNGSNLPPTFNYDSLLLGCYAININPLTAFYYDSNGVLQEDYQIVKSGSDPLLFKPLCDWIYGGKLAYDDIQSPNGFNYMDAINNPYMTVCYGSDATGNEMNECDRYVKVNSCDIFENDMCIEGEEMKILECPL